MKYLITGSAGFIGFHTCKSLLSNKKNFVYGIDNLNNYYDPKIKKDRLKILSEYQNFKFKKLDIKNYKNLKKQFSDYHFDIVIHFAAQAGVRYSFENPKAYFESNMLGFFNLLECIRESKIKHFLFASTSSVYGNNDQYPTKENSNTNSPLSFYSATKKSNEIMAYSYSNMYKIPITAMRFFTVYGPYGRPDMAIFKFTNLIKAKKKIDIYNSGNHSRDFTYIDDTVKGINALVKKIPNKDIPFQLYNVASGKSIKLQDIIFYLEKFLKTKIKYNYLDIQKGDAVKTHADVTLFRKKTSFKSSVNIELGIKKFIKWYDEYYG